MAEKLRNIFYVACARRSDGTTVAAYGQKAYADEVAKLISSPGFRQKTKPGARTSLTSKNGTFHMLGNKEGLVLVVVTSTSYPSRTMYSGFCEDVFHQFQSKNFNWQECEANKWSSKFKGNLASLCKEYDDPAEKNKVAKLQGQVQQVQGVMQQNISKALQNVATTKDLDAKAEDLAEAGLGFKRKAKKLAWKEWCALQKIRVVILLVLILIIIVVVVMVCNGECGGDDAAPAAAAPTASVTAATPSGAGD